MDNHPPCSLGPTGTRPANQPRGRWRFLRCSLRTLFLQLTVAGVIGGWFLNNFEQQRRAIAALESRGASIYVFVGEEKSENMMPATWQGRTCEFFFGRATSANGVSLTCDADLVHLSRLRDVEWFSPAGECSQAAVTESGLRSLAGHPKLQRFFLADVEFTPPGIDSVASLSRLNTLWLTDCQFPKSGITPLRRLKKLETLSLAGSKFDLHTLSTLQEFDELTGLIVSDVGLDDTSLDPILACRHLAHLYAGENRITDAGVAKLVQSFADLEYLYLDGNGIGDKSVAEIVQLKKLIRLNLARTKITDDALPLLSELPALWDLDLSGTDITDEGLKSLLDCPEVGQLHLQGTTITARGLQTIRPVLERLSILDLPAETFGEKELKEMHSSLSHPFLRLRVLRKDEVVE